MYPQQNGYMPPIQQYQVGFGEAISRGFSNYANFSGRASRSEYWWWALFNFILFLIPGILMAMGLVGAASSASYYDSYYGYHSNTDIYEGLFFGTGLTGLIIYAILALVLIIPNLSITWRRLHDIGRSGAWYLLCLVPFLNYVWSIVLLVWYCTASKPFDNQYGPVPNLKNF